MIKRIVKLIFVTFIFFVTAQLGYDYFYRITLATVKFLSPVPLNFFGKFRGMIFGDLNFSAIVATIPLLVFIISQLIKTKSVIITTLLFSLFFTAVYLFICWRTSIELLASNSFHKHEEEKFYNVGLVELNTIFLKPIICSGVLTVTALVLKGAIGKRD